jgi:hypothetical protein
MGWWITGISTDLGVKPVLGVVHIAKHYPACSPGDIHIIHRFYYDYDEFY